MEVWKPSEWFSERLQEWHNDLKAWHIKHVEYKDPNKRAAAGLVSMSKSAGAPMSKSAGPPPGPAPGGVLSKARPAGGVESKAAPGQKSGVNGDGASNQEQLQQLVEEMEREDLDIFGVDDVCDVKEAGNAPLFSNFTFEDWALLSLRFELHLLVHAIRKDGAGQLGGVPPRELAAYYTKYYKKNLDPKNYGSESVEDVLRLVGDTAVIGMRTMVVEPMVKAELASNGIFVKLTEGNRRDRKRKLDAGDQAADLKFPRPNAGGPPPLKAPPPAPAKPQGQVIMPKAGVVPPAKMPMQGFNPGMGSPGMGNPSMGNPSMGGFGMPKAPDNFAMSASMPKAPDNFAMSASMPKAPDNFAMSASMPKAPDNFAMSASMPKAPDNFAMSASMPKGGDTVGYGASMGKSGSFGSGSMMPGPPMISAPGSMAPGSMMPGPPMMGKSGAMTPAAGFGSAVPKMVMPDNSGHAVPKMVMPDNSGWGSGSMTMPKSAGVSQDAFGAPSMTMAKSAGVSQDGSGVPKAGLGDAQTPEKPFSKGGAPAVFSKSPAPSVAMPAVMSKASMQMPPQTGWQSNGGDSGWQDNGQSKGGDSGWQANGQSTAGDGGWQDNSKGGGGGWQDNGQSKGGDDGWKDNGWQGGSW